MPRSARVHGWQLHLLAVADEPRGVRTALPVAEVVAAGSPGAQLREGDVVLGDLGRTPPTLDEAQKLGFRLDGRRRARAR
jgi:hypothetical protein